ncbi:MULTISPECIES: hypothetical protein [Paraburkholderia]|uniref:hypothetical protein n=1 Tax=Paraburkholderia TaxID=1822464 RepID=UPI0038BA5A07
MATLNRDEAVRKAIELVDTALAAGLIKDVNPCSYNHPEKSGRDTAQYLCGLMQGLAEKIGEL